jgi:hypothetical protein
MHIRDGFCVSAMCSFGVNLKGHSFQVLMSGSACRVWDMHCSHMYFRKELCCAGAVVVLALIRMRLLPTLRPHISHV